ncbi:MAG TPA: DUF4956 domain-containing protein [Gemmatimonadales bacterium]|nr:DUF4956 domain-containing protein [Gemmatimonadales bacterium]
MSFISRLMDLGSGGSESPVRRLIVYYVFLTAITMAVLWLVPATEVVFSGERLEEIAATPRLLQDGLSKSAAKADLPLTAVAGAAGRLPPRLEMVVVTACVSLGALLLMLPVSWVFMSVRRTTGYSQSIVHTMLILPIVVAGIVLIVRNSLALAFSLAGIMAGVRFRTGLKDARDTVFIFLAIGVGLAAGVQALTVAALISVIFNFVVLTVWRSDYGRSPLTLAPAVEWGSTLGALAEPNGGSPVPDRELLLSLTPEKADTLAERFTRVRDLLVGGGGKGKKPRYNALLKVTASDALLGQRRTEEVLRSMTKRWTLDESRPADDGKAELYYLVRFRKKTQDDVIGALLAHGRDSILGAEIELGPGLAKTA